MDSYWTKYKNDDLLEAQTRDKKKKKVKEDSLMSEYERHRQKLLKQGRGDEEGWGPELRRYLGIVERDAKRGMNVIEWWQVRNRYPFTVYS